MHSGKLYGRSKAAHLYRLFKAAGYGRWCGAFDLNKEIQSLAFGTIVAEVNDQLRREGLSERIENEMVRHGGKVRSMYRLIRTEPEQMEFQLPIDSAVVEG